MRRKAFLFAPGLVCVAGLLASWPGGASRAVEAPRIDLLTREVSLGKLAPGAIVQTLATSPDRRHLAYLLERGDKCLVVVDGVEGKEYDCAGFGYFKNVFSPDSKRVAYCAQSGAEELVVVDSKVIFKPGISRFLQMGRRSS